MNGANAKILVPIDGSEYSAKALDVAVDLARAAEGVARRSPVPVMIVPPSNL